MVIFFLILIVFALVYIVHNSRRNFEVRKSRLMNLYSSVLSDMNMDFRDNAIWVLNIGEISKSIKNFSNEINKLQKEIQKEPLTEQEWLINLIQEFTANLHLWIERHVSELEIVENTIEKIETQDVWKKWALELATSRLVSHIKLLERI